jgi:hypothetical protein
VALQFQHVLAGIRSGGREMQQQAAIDQHAGYITKGD